jgi:hypothetical protein
MTSHMDDNTNFALRDSFITYISGHLLVHHALFRCFWASRIYFEEAFCTRRRCLMSSHQSTHVHYLNCFSIRLFLSSHRRYEANRGYEASVVFLCDDISFPTHNDF